MTQEVQELRELMRLHKLTRRDVAKLCDVHEVTVDSWLAPESAALHRGLHPRHVGWLKMRLGRDPLRKMRGIGTDLSSRVA